MRNILKGQSLRFDAHDSGSGKPVAWGNGLHLHKTMNRDRYNGAEVLIPLDNDFDIEFRNIRGRNKNIEGRIRNEIYDVLTKDPQKRREFSDTIFKQIERFSLYLPKRDRIINLRTSADRIAKHFSLTDHVREEIQHDIFKNIKQYLTTHLDDEGTVVYILQDVDGKTIKIGENLEILETEDLKFNIKAK